MRDLSRSNRIPATVAPPKGLAFAIADLIRAQNWAMVPGRGMQVRLDHGTDGEEYEEVIEFHTGRHMQSKTIMWRSARAVFIQPLPGRRQRYRSVPEALDGLLSNQRVADADAVATPRPAD